MKKVSLFVVLICFSLQGLATHIRGGEITIKQKTGYSFEITLRGIANPLVPVKMGGGKLDFGDGSRPVISPSNGGKYGQTLDSALGIYLFTVEHLYPGPGFYRVTYFEEDFVYGIINVSNPFETPLFLESGFVIDPLLNSPLLAFASDPIFQFTMVKPYSFSSAPVDTISSIYDYELVVPQQAAGTAVSDYIFPENLKINSQTGLLTWDTKFQNKYTPGEYLVAVRVKQFDRKRNYLGYVIRVFTILLQEKPSKILLSNPVSDPQGKVLVLTGNQKTLKVFVSDTVSMDSVFWNSYFDRALSDNVSFRQYDSATATKKIKVGLLTLTSTPGIARDLPYQIILRGISLEADSSLAKDISILFLTKDVKDVEDVEVPMVTAVTSSNEQISVYPNPCTNELHFSRRVNNARVDVMNNIGQLVRQSAIDTDEYIDTYTLSPGIYFLILSENSRKYCFKLIKK